MARPQPKFTNEQKSEILKAFQEEKREKGYLKIMVLKYKALDGLNSREISERTGFHKDYINRIVGQYKRQGLDTVVARSVARNHAYLSLEEETEFLESFRKRALKGEILDIVDISKALNEHVNREVGLYLVYDMLKRHNWACNVYPRRTKYQSTN